MLERCLESLDAGVGSDMAGGSDIAGRSDKANGSGCRIILVDNGSNDGVTARVRDEFPRVEVIELGRNDGFAAAVNRGLEKIAEPYVLMLNTDAVLTPGALETMAAALDSADDDCAGVAPKMMSSAHEGIIDAVGTVMPRNGAGFNRGIGQCDLGQYDGSDEVAGVCFGAALLRRRLFEPEAVGRLYEGYFLYFEDSDWCMRAASQGYRFLTVPDSVVLHLHSGVARNESLDFKYQLIELNTLKLVVRTFESRVQLIEAVAARCARLLARTFIRRRFIRANIYTLSTFARQLPGLLRERRQLRQRRIVSDDRVFELGAGEAAYFDTVEYRPDRCLDSLIATYLRLLKERGDPETGRRLALLYRLQLQEARGLKPGLPRDGKNLFEGEPACVKELLDLAAANG
ncbi:MAG: glycosyltransferase [Actinobacteria bacterium]|nr:glycosyltransferase [Actinomycetota bacterium]MCL5883507.1 glycosyltransferase [Actinomycetota bacterium]